MPTARLPTRFPMLRWALPVLVVGVVALVWWTHGGDGQSYRTSTVERGPIQVSISATGNLKARSTVEIGSQLSGLVLSVTADFNQHVAKDEVIAVIDPANFQARVNQAQADLTSALANLTAARANLVEARATLRNLDAEYLRKQQVFKRQLISQSEFDAALAARDQSSARLASMQAAVKVAESQVVQRRAAVENAELDLGYTVIRSPVDGVVISRTVEPGQTVAASFQTPVLFSIAEDLSKMQLDLSIDEADVGQLHAGLPVRFAVDAYPGREFTGSVRQVRLAATNTANVITYPVVVDVDNPDSSLLPGMTANAEVLVAERDQVLRVANAVLRFKPSGAAPLPTPNAGPGQAAGRGAAGTGDPAGGRPAGNAMAQWTELADRLQLDAGQREQLRSAVSAVFKDQRAQSDGTAQNADQRRRQINAAIRAALQALRATLSATQQQQLDAELMLQASARRVTVWRLERGKPAAIMIRVGLSDSSHTEVLGGLDAGAELIVAEESPAP